MKEYIEREALNKVIDHEIEVCNSGIAKDVLKMLKVRVEPAADVVEVRYGKNLSEDDPSRFKCSECGWGCWDTYCGDTITYSFCPNCGAKMDKEE